jgi:hypothetical protein
MRPNLAGIALSLCLTAIACGGSPAGPTDITRSSERRVQSGGGGGSACDPLLCPPGTVVATASGAVLHGDTDWDQLGSDPRIFSFAADLAGEGRFRSGRLTATVNVANVDVEFLLSGRATGSGRADVLFHDQGSATPDFQTASDPACPSGQRLDTTVELQLESLGRTVIEESHCIPVTP